MSDMMPDILQTEEEQEDTISNKFLIFDLDNQEYAIAIQHVVDIINVQPVTHVPSCPEFVRGITNLRGKVIPIIDVRLRFGKFQQDYNERTCIIVVEMGDVSVGMIVDSVKEVITMEENQIAPPPSFQNGVDVRFVSGVGKAEDGIKLILDCHTVLDDYAIPAADVAGIEE